MVDVTVTAAEVLPGTDTQYAHGVAGVAITGGQSVYLDSTTSTYKLADADDTAATAAVVGIAMNTAAANARLTVATSGSLDPGFTVTVGQVYVVSGTAGGIAPVADLATSDIVSIIGVGASATSLTLAIKNTGIIFA